MHYIEIILLATFIMVVGIMVFIGFYKEETTIQTDYESQTQQCCKAAALMFFLTGKRMEWSNAPGRPIVFWESHAYFRTSEPFVGIEPVYTCGYCGTSDDPNDICDLCFAKLMSHNAGPFKGDYTIMDEEDYLENYGYCDYDAEEEAYQAQFAATDYYGRMMATFSDDEDDLDVYDAKPDLTRKEIRISKRATSSLKHKNLTPKPKSKA